MRNLVITHSLYYPFFIGGAEISTQILAETLSSYFNVHVITVGKQSGSEGIIKEIHNKVTIYRLPYNNWYWIGEEGEKATVKKIGFQLMDLFNVNQYKLLKSLLADIRPFVVHSQNLWGLSFAVWKAASDLQIPIVHTLRDYALLKPIKSAIYSAFYSIIASNFSKQVSSVIGISNYILNEHLKSNYFKTSHKFVVPNVVDGVVEKKHKKYNHSALKIGYFGRLTEEKGVQYLIEAVKQLPNGIIQELLICGDGSYKNHLLRITNGNHTIKFIGKMTHKQVKQTMAEMDLIVVPSIWEEPFGRVIIEAYQVGTPVIATQVGGIPEVINRPEQFLVKPRDSRSIRNAITAYYYLSHIGKQDIEKECLDHCKRFTTHALLENHLNIYKKYQDTTI